MTYMKIETQPSTVYVATQGVIGPQGPQGERGETGTGIIGITEDVSTEDKGINTISISLSDGSVQTVTVQNGSKGSVGETGNGIEEVRYVATPEDDKYNMVTFVMTDSSTSTFGVKNGAKGSTGLPAGFGTPTASVDSNIGTPSVEITASGEDTAKVFDFAFHNMKGEKGDTPVKGTDYWTDADKTEIVNDVLAQMTNMNGMAF